MTAFLLLTCLQLLILVFFIVKFPLREELDRFLLLISIGACMAVLSKVLFEKIHPGHNMHHSISSTLCIAGMGYLFIKEFLTDVKNTRRSIILHLLPFAFSVLLAGYELFSIYGYHLWSLSTEHLIDKMIEHMRLLGLIVYLLLDMRLYYKHKARFWKTFRTINGSMALYFFVHKLMLLLMIGLTSFVVHEMNPYLLFAGLLTLPIMVFVILYYKVFLKLKTTTMQLQVQLQEQTAVKLSVVPKVKYQKTRIDGQKMETHNQRIHTYLDKKPYLDLNFSMDTFAAEVGLSNHELSMLLSKMDTSFYQLINKLRVAYFVEHITDILQQEKTILALAYESGFNSKSTFNKYFKQNMGLSPSAYIKELAEQSLSLS